MVDDLHKGLIRLGGKPFRRVRKHVGETWKPGAPKALTEPGVYCAACRTRHAWRNRKTLGAKYEMRQGTWHIIWYCMKTGNVLKDQGLVRKGTS